VPFTLGWRIVGFTATANFISVGIGYYTFGVYLKPLSEAFDESRFWVALGLSMQTIFMAVLGPLVGRLMSDYPMRNLMCLGVCMISLGLFICSQATNVWHLYIGFGMCVSLGVILTSNMPCNLILAYWFVRRRGVALGISQAGITISGVILVPLATYFVVTFGWRVSFGLFAIIAPVVLLPLIWKFAIRSPADVGLYPDGALKPPPPPAPSPDGDDWSFKKAIRVRDIWLISCIAGPCYMAIAAIVIALPSHGTDLGLTPMQASSAVLVTTLFGAIAKPVAGALSDFVSKRSVLAAAIALQFVGTGILLVADDLVTLCIAGGVFGLGYGGIAPLWSLLLAQRFGLTSFARVMGAAMPLTMPFSLIGLPLTTLVFEATGTYLPAFGFLMFSYVAAALCLWKLYAPGTVLAATLR
jgi:MFS family permease